MHCGTSNGVTRFVSCSTIDRARGEEDPSLPRYSFTHTLTLSLFLALSHSFSFGKTTRDKWQLVYRITIVARSAFEHDLAATSSRENVDEHDLRMSLRLLGGTSDLRRETHSSNLATPSSCLSREVRRMTICMLMEHAPPRVHSSVFIGFSLSRSVVFTTRTRTTSLGNGGP